MRIRGKSVKGESITFEKEFIKFQNLFVLLPCGDGVAELQNSVFIFHVQLKQSAATGMYLSEESHVVILTLKSLN